MTTSQKTLLTYLGLTLLAALTGCGSNNKFNNNVYIGGANDRTSDSELFVGQCGGWDIAGRYEGAVITGKCQIKLDCGGSFEITNGFVYNSEFEVSQNVYGEWVFDTNSTCDFQQPNNYDMCKLRKIGSTTQVDCVDVSVDLEKK